MSRFNTVQVYVDLERIGNLHCQQSGKGDIFSFQYDKTWLTRPESFSFDPVEC